MIRARSVEEYVALIKDAIYEIDDMKAAIEYDGDSMSGAMTYVDEMAAELRVLYEKMGSGDYCWNTGDLRFMAYVKQHDEHSLPFRQLLIRINETHNKGLEEAGET